MSIFLEFGVIGSLNVNSNNRKHNLTAVQQDHALVYFGVGLADCQVADHLGCTHMEVYLYRRSMRIPTEVILQNRANLARPAPAVPGNDEGDFDD